MIEWLQQHLQTDTSTSDSLFWITISLIGLWIGLKLSFKKKLIIRLPLTLGDSVETMQRLRSREEIKCGLILKSVSQYESETTLDKS